MYSEGIVAVLSDPYNVGIIIFLVILGIVVPLMNKSGASAAFGRWAQTKIKNRVGAQLATIGLGILIFIDDYFNCLTVGSVMRPVTDKFKISRAKLAYLIDSTAALSASSRRSLPGRLRYLALYLAKKMGSRFSSSAFLTISMRSLRSRSSF